MPGKVAEAAHASRSGASGDGGEGGGGDGEVVTTGDTRYNRPFRFRL